MKCKQSAVEVCGYGEKNKAHLMPYSFCGEIMYLKMHPCQDYELELSEKI